MNHYLEEIDNRWARTDGRIVEFISLDNAVAADQQ